MVTAFCDTTQAQIKSCVGVNINNNVMSKWNITAVYSTLPFPLASMPRSSDNDIIRMSMLPRSMLPHDGKHDLSRLGFSHIAAPDFCIVGHAYLYMRVLK